MDSENTHQLWPKCFKENRFQTNFGKVSKILRTDGPCCCGNVVFWLMQLLLILFCENSVLFLFGETARFLSYLWHKFCNLSNVSCAANILQCAHHDHHFHTHLSSYLVPISLPEKSEIVAELGQLISTQHKPLTTLVLSCTEYLAACSIEAAK